MALKVELAQPRVTGKSNTYSEVSPQTPPVVASGRICPDSMQGKSLPMHQT